MRVSMITARVGLQVQTVEAAWGEPSLEEALNSPGAHLAWHHADSMTHQVTLCPQCHCLGLDPCRRNMRTTRRAQRPLVGGPSHTGLLAVPEKPQEHSHPRARVRWSAFLDHSFSKCLLASPLASSGVWSRYSERPYPIIHLNWHPCGTLSPPCFSVFGVMALIASSGFPLSPCIRVQL